MCPPDGVIQGPETVSISLVIVGVGQGWGWGCLEEDILTHK